MALNIYCATEDCRWHKEKKGGNFEMRDGKLFCSDCIEERRCAPVIGQTCANLWDFTTTHINGEKIHIKSLGQLRRLEKQYGLSNQAANNMERNWGTAPSRNGPAMNPELQRLVERGNSMRFGRSEISGGFDEKRR